MQTLKVKIPLGDLSDSFQVADGEEVRGKKFDMSATCEAYADLLQMKLEVALAQDFPGAQVDVYCTTRDMGRSTFYADGFDNNASVEEQAELTCRVVSEELWGDSEKWAIYR